MLDFLALAEQCASALTPDILQRIVKVESSYNPYAIGVVGGGLSRQPKNRSEAISTAKYLHRNGWNFSMGLGQINYHNLRKYSLDYETVFDPCHNLRVTAEIFQECLFRARKKLAENDALPGAFSCYYSGNFWRGFQPEGRSQQSYVSRIMAVEAKLADGSPEIKVFPTRDRPKKVRESGERDDEHTVTRQKGGRLSQLKGKQKSVNIKELRGD